MSPLEIVGFVTGAACVWLATRRHVLNYPIGIVSTSAFLLLFLDAKLYANAVLQVLFIVLGVVGWWSWLKAREADATIRARAADPRVWAVSILSFAVLAAAGWWALSQWTDSTVPLADAATTASSVVAQVLLNRRFRITWPWWIATDVALIGLYWSQGLHLTAVLYVILLVMCLFGVREWRAERPVASKSVA